MATFETFAHVGPDGTLNLRLSLPPALANTDVLITVEPARLANRTPLRTMTDEEWREFISRFAGSMPDFPDVERPGPDDYEDRDWS